MRHLWLYIFFAVCTLASCEEKAQPSDESDAAEAAMEAVPEPLPAPSAQAPSSEEILLKAVSPFEQYNTKDGTPIADFSGEYLIVYEDESRFTLTLAQSGSEVSGSYCGYSATRVDCGVEQQGAPDCPVKGKVFGKSCYVAFISCYRGSKGTAKLLKKGQDILWQTMQSPPDPDGGYFSAPDRGILYKQGTRGPERKYKPDFSGMAGAFTLSSGADTGLTYMVNDAMLYKTAQFRDETGRLNKDEQVDAEITDSKYVVAREGDITLSLPIYRVRQKGKTGYMQGGHLPFKQFADGQGNLFQVGMDSEYKWLKMTVYDTDGLLDEIMLFHKVYVMDASTSSYRELVFELDYLKDIQLKGLHFFRCTWTNNGSGGYQGSAYFYWNGLSLSKLNPPNDFKGDIMDIDLSTLSDTLVYTLTTGTIKDESGEYSNEEIRALYFVSNGQGLVKVE
ncbi:MAG: hypothetical protein AB8F95_13650 [Bacteroidia bacterium]